MVQWIKSGLNNPVWAASDHEFWSHNSKPTILVMDPMGSRLKIPEYNSMALLNIIDLWCHILYSSVMTPSIAVYISSAPILILFNIYIKTYLFHKSDM